MRLMSSMRYLKAGRHRLNCTTGCLTDEPENQEFRPGCCAHTTAAGGCRAGWLEWSRLWRKSEPVVSDVSGIQVHLGLSNGCRASHSQSEPWSELLDLGEKGVYYSYTSPGVKRPRAWVWHRQRSVAWYRFSSMRT